MGGTGAMGGTGGVGGAGGGSDIGAAPFFPSGTYWLSQGKGTRHLVSGDFDGDGRTDAAMLTTEPDTIQIMLGKGGGVLEYKTTIPLQESVIVFYALHADQDGKLDLVGANDCGDPTLCNAVWTLRGNGDGTFLPPLFSGGEAYFGNSGEAGDIDGDGDTDIVNGMDSNNGGVILRNAGDGTFVVEWSGGQYDVALPDFDKDGILDYVGVDYAWVSVLLGAGDGSYKFPGTGISVNEDVSRVEAGDLDADGDQDFVTFSWGEDIITRFESAGDGKAFIPSELHLGYLHHRSPVLTDFDGDQDDDLALVSDGKIVVAYSSDGTFVPGPVISNFPALRILPADMNSDAKKDLLVGSDVGVTVLLNAP